MGSQGNSQGQKGIVPEDNNLIYCGRSKMDMKEAEVIWEKDVAGHRGQEYRVLETEKWLFISKRQDHSSVAKANKRIVKFKRKENKAGKTEPVNTPPERGSISTYISKTLFQEKQPWQQKFINHEER